jgi:hypothetical protein
MAKYLLLKHYRGGPAPAVDWAPMDQWTPDEVDAHVQFMRDFAARLEETGEFVDTQALAPDGAFVRYDGEGPVTDGPFAETKDLIAEWYGTARYSWRGSCRRPPGRRQADLRMAGGSAVSGRLAHGHRVNEPLLRDLVPAYFSTSGTWARMRLFQRFSRSGPITSRGRTWSRLAFTCTSATSTVRRFRNQSGSCLEPDPLPQTTRP